MKSLISVLHDNPRTVALVGSASGWASVDWLRAAQFMAATLAGAVSLCALILVLPKAIRELGRWVRRGVKLVMALAKP